MKYLIVVWVLLAFSNLGRSKAVVSQTFDDELIYIQNCMNQEVESISNSAIDFEKLDEKYTSECFDLKEKGLVCFSNSIFLWIHMYQYQHDLQHFTPPDFLI